MVELMTHPIARVGSGLSYERQFQTMLQRVNVGGYALV